MTFVDMIVIALAVPTAIQAIIWLAERFMR